MIIGYSLGWIGSALYEFRLIVAKVGQFREETPTHPFRIQDPQQGWFSAWTIWRLRELCGPDFGAETEKNSATAVLVADYGVRPLEVTEARAAVGGIPLAGAHGVHRGRNVEAGSLVRDCDQCTVSGQHDLNRDRLSPIAPVAVLIGIAESVFQWSE
jgi:hypothetical protein